MNAADRVALILGRAIIRAETLEAELAAARARLTDLENADGPSDAAPDDQPD